MHFAFMYYLYTLFGQNWLEAKDNKKYATMCKMARS